MDIKLIPIEELKKDRQESIDDISNCKKALIFGVTKYSSGNIIDRLQINKNIVIKIDKELLERDKEKVQ